MGTGELIAPVEVPTWFGLLVELGPIVALVLLVGLVLHFGALLLERLRP